MTLPTAQPMRMLELAQGCSGSPRRNFYRWSYTLTTNSYERL